MSKASQFLIDVKRFARRAFGRKVYTQSTLPSAYHPADQKEQFYLDGYLCIGLERSSILERLQKTLTEIARGPLQAPFHWEQKAEGYFLLRPNPVTYSSIFMDFLFDGGLLTKIKQLTDLDLYLTEVAFIHHTPGIRNDWHRDTYIYNNEPIGPFPAAYKLIYYPLLGAETKPQLGVIPGTHRRVYFDRTTDESLIKKRYRREILSSDDYAVLFDSAIFHEVCPETRPEGSYRLHYIFVRKSQLSTERYRYNQKLHDQFIDRLQSATQGTRAEPSLVAST